MWINEGLMRNEIMWHLQHSSSNFSLLFFSASRWDRRRAFSWRDREIWDSRDTSWDLKDINSSDAERSFSTAMASCACASADLSLKKKSIIKSLLNTQRNIKHHNSYPIYQRCFSPVSPRMLPGCPVMPVSSQSVAAGDALPMWHSGWVPGSWSRLPEAAVEDDRQTDSMKRASVRTQISTWAISASFQCAV